MHVEAETPAITLSPMAAYFDDVARFLNASKDLGAEAHNLSRSTGERMLRTLSSSPQRQNSTLGHHETARTVLKTYSCLCQHAEKISAAVNEEWYSRLYNDSEKGWDESDDEEETTCLLETHWSLQPKWSL